MGAKHDQEENLLRSVALQNAKSILAARQRAEEELLNAKEALERKTEEVAHSLAMMRATLESTTDGILVTDGSGTVTMFNQKFVEMWRIPLETMRSAKHAQLVEVVREKFRNPEQFRAKIEQIYRSSPPETYDLLELADGRVFERFSKIQRIEERNVGRVWSFRDITAHRRTEDELRQQREWFEVTLSSIGDAVITTDTATRVTFLNPIAEEMTGWKSADAFGLPLEKIFQIVDERTGQSIAHPVTRALTEGTVVGLANHTALIARDGKQTAIEDSAAPIRNAAGHITGAVMVFHDVSERRQTEEALRQSEERFRASFHQAAVGMAIASSEGRFEQINERFSQILGYQPAELYDRTFRDITHPEDLPRTLFEMRRLLAGEIADYSIEKRYVRKDGSIVWSCSTVSLLKNDNAPERFIGAIEDITARKNAEEALRARERELSLIFNNVSDIIFYLSAEADDRFRFLSVNQAFLDATGLSESRVTGKLVEEVIPQPSYSLALENYKKAIREKKTSRWEETTDYPSGRRVGAVSVTPIFDSRGKCINLIGTVHDLTERKRSEEVRVRLAAVVESSDDAIVSKTLEGIITSWNKGAQRMFGYSPEEIIGQPVTVLIPPDYRDEEPEILRKLKRGERIEHYETVRMRKDGTLLNVSIAVSPIKDGAGKTIGASKIARDITEQKAAEERLRKSEARFRQLADAMPQIVWTATPDGRFDYLSRRWHELTEAPPAVDRSAIWNAALHPNDAPRFLNAWQQAVATGEPFQAEYRLKTGADGYRWHLGRALAVRNDAGEILRWYGSSTEIHEQKLTAEALREEYAITEHLHEVAKALATELDLEKVVQIITDAGTRVTRAQLGAFFYNGEDEKRRAYPPYTFSGVATEMFDRFPMPRALDLFGPTFLGEGVIRLDDVRKDSRFGNVPPDALPVVSYLAVPVFSRSGEVLGGLFFGHSEPAAFTLRDEKVVLGIAAQAAAAMDIARTYHAEQLARTAAEQANRAKDHFIAALSHELRTPLTPALAILSDLRHDATIPAALAEDLETVRRNVELEARLIDDLLDLARVARGKLELHCARVAIGEMVDDAINTCLVDLQAKHISLVRDLVDPPPTISADSARVTQILWNLLKNSIKFTPDGGTITLRSRVTTEKETDQLVLEVHDTGIGIEAGHLDRVFDAFEQGGRRITRQFGGLGLGLAISKAIAESHGGSLTASSAGANQGSTFTLTLPVSGPSGPESLSIPVTQVVSEAAKPGFLGTDHGSLRILLAEDHMDTAAILLRLLRRMGHEVIHANTLRSALELAQSETATTRLDLVMSDLGLPDGSGLDLMRELSTKYQLPGIALSGFGMDSDVQQSIEAGFSHHLIKPIDISVLRTTIAEVMRGR